MLFDNIKKGDEVSIHDTRIGDGEPVCIYKVSKALAKQIRAGGSNYLRSTGMQVGDNRFQARPLTPEKKAEIEASIEERLERADAERKAKAQAAYDALPEAIKLARKLRYVCDMNSEADIAAAPIEHLRALVEWFAQQGKETE